MVWWKRLFGLDKAPQVAGASPAPSDNLGLAGTPEGHIGHRRALCWWEPIFDPSVDGTLNEWDWDFSDNSGPLRQFLSGEKLSSKVEKGDTFKLSHLTFKECDFQGDFRPGVIVLFDTCTFILCDFAFSTWKDTNFRNCTFEDCSISLATFERCEFRENKWRRTGFSGSKTDFLRCFLTNPEELIYSGFSGRKVNDKTTRHRMFQWHRLQGTKAHLSRTILLGHEEVGDDRTFYRSARLHDLQQSYAKMSRNVYDICFEDLTQRLRALVGLLFNSIENLILRFFGILNGWGASAIRPLMCIVLCYVVFGYLYSTIDLGEPIPNPFQKSFDVTSLVGYGSQTQAGIGPTLSFFQDIHAVIAIVLYTVFFATIVSKLSRVRS